MAIAFDAASQSSVFTGTSGSFSHTCTGSNRLLVVCITIENSAETISGITYNGTALTLAKRHTTTNECVNEIWYLENPDNGSSHTISITKSDSTWEARAVALSYNGVLQSSSLDDTAESGTEVDTGSNYRVTADVTTTTSGQLIVDCAFNDFDETFTPSGNQTERKDLLINFGRIGVSDRIVGSADTYTMYWDESDYFPDGMGIAVATFKAAPTGTPANDERDAETTGIDTTESERDAEVTGSLSSSSERSAEVTGQVSSERDAEVHGKNSAQSERAAEVEGQSISERSAEVHGVDTAQSERDAETIGSVSVDDERDAETDGIDTANSERSAEVTGAAAPVLTAAQDGAKITLTWTYDPNP